MNNLFNTVIVSSILLAHLSFAQPSEWINYTNGNRILKLLNDSAYLWVGTTGGLVQLNKNNDEMVFFNKGNSGLSGNLIRSLAKDDSGNLWVGAMALSKYDGINWQTYTTANSGIPKDYTGAQYPPNVITIDKDTNLWIGLGDIICKIKSDGTLLDSIETGSPYSAFSQINDINIDNNGDAWICATWGLGKVDSTGLMVFDSINGSVSVLTFDVHGNIWIGTGNAGLIKFDGQNWTVFNTTNSGLPSNIIYEMG